MSGSIYVIKCVPTGLQYVGQTCDTKTKKGKPYNYGPVGRWSDHVSTSYKSETPLSRAIRQYGKESFTVDVLERGRLEQLDEMEAKWINRLNTIIPNGLNVARHSRNKHHTNTTLPNYFRELVESAVLRPIRRNGEFSLVYLTLKLKDGTLQRITFGQNQAHDYQKARNDALAFVDNLGCSWTEEIYASPNLSEKYATKLKLLANKVLTRIRLTKASGLIAIYISTDETRNHKEQIRICFGGKNISHEEAYLTALDFIHKLNPNPEIIEDSITQSPQQVAANQVVAQT